MNNSKRLFVNVKPGHTFLDHLTGKTKVRTFLILIFVLIATWDIRVILPFLFLFIGALISLKPDWHKVWGVLGFIIIVNLFNLFLMWLVEPNYGLNVVGGSTVFGRLNGFYVFTYETFWYFFVRFSKFMATFILSLVFIMSITPSEFAAGLYSIKVPYKACTIVSLAFRYIPDIARDFQNIRISMQARGMELDSKRTKLGNRVKQNILILAPLIVTSFDRVGNIANAMDLRGFGKKKIRTYYAEHEDTKGDRIMKPVYLAFLALLIVLTVEKYGFPSAYEVWCPWIH